MTKEISLQDAMRHCYYSLCIDRQATARANARANEHRQNLD